MALPRYPTMPDPLGHEGVMLSELGFENRIYEVNQISAPVSSVYMCSGASSKAFTERATAGKNSSSRSLPGTFGLLPSYGAVGDGRQAVLVQSLLRREVQGIINAHVVFIPDPYDKYFFETPKTLNGFFVSDNDHARDKPAT